MENRSLPEEAGTGFNPQTEANPAESIPISSKLKISSRTLPPSGSRIARIDR
jgi:hypothetical protein